MLTDLLSRLLEARGLQTPEDREKFLQPNYARDIADPFLLRDMERAVKRILEAVKKGEKIIIFADYDADGVPGAAILAEFFKKINYPNFEVYIPNRHTEDYGLMEQSVREFAANGAKLIITVDCGISNGVEVVLASSLGLDVIITDHHLPPSELPPAFAIINPKQASDTYPDKMLCGAALAWKLVQGLLARLGATAPPLNWEKTLLDLVAIATISDRVPLLAENRALTKFGLMILQRSRRPGLLALFASAKLKPENLTEDDVGFVLGPRLNAAGRMSHASEAYFLLTATDLTAAREMAGHLEKKNDERKKLVEQILQTVVAKISPETAVNLPVIVLGDQAWSPGVLGLAASRLVEKFARPVFLWGGNNNEIKGSCRSDGSVNIVELMRLVETGFFTNCGGHGLAGGFALAKAKVGELEAKLLSAYQQVPKLEKTAEAKCDATLEIDDVDENLWRALATLAPFGVGNPKPLFHFPNLEIVQAKTFGNGGIHLELGFAKTGGEIICAIGFFTPRDKFVGVKLENGARINLTATLEKSYFKFRPELRLRIVDIKIA